MSKNFYIIFLFLLFNVNINSNQYFPQSSQKNLIQKGSLICKDNFITDSLLISPSKNLITEKANFNEIKINQLKTEEIEIDTLETNLIIPNNKENTLVLNGEIFVTGQVSFDNSEEVDYNSILKQKKEEELNDKLKGVLEQSFIQIENKNNKINQFNEIHIGDNMFDFLNRFINLFIVKKNKRIEFEEKIKIRINENNLRNKDYIMISFSLKKLEIFDIATFYIKNNNNEYLWVSESKETFNEKFKCDEYNTDSYNFMIPIEKNSIKNYYLNLIFGIKFDKEEYINDLRECNNNNDLIHFDNLEIFLK